jgi:glucans biosynthesis protein
VIATRAGASADGNRRVYMIDFSGSGEKVDGLRVELSASAGRTSNLTLVPNPTVHGFRVGFELDSSNAEVIELRLKVLRGNRPITETWLYRWTTS